LKKIFLSNGSIDFVGTAAFIYKDKTRNAGFEGRLSFNGWSMHFKKQTVPANDSLLENELIKRFKDDMDDTIILFKKELIQELSKNDDYKIPALFMAPDYI